MEINTIYIVAPVVGGVIGYITNALAIRMLFRPHSAKYIFGWQLPFTPGIIPKEKYRIADAIGGVISQNLMNKDVLEKYLLSEDMISKIRHSVEEFFNEQKENKETLREFLLHYLSQGEINLITKSANDELSQRISAKLSDSSVGEKVAHIAVEHITARINLNGAQEILSHIGGIIGLLGGASNSIVRNFLEMLREPTERYLSGQINDMLKEHGSEIVSNMIGQEINSFMNIEMCKLLEGRNEQIENIVKTIEKLYKVTIREHLHRILGTVDICKIVSERIKQMNVNETEKLIFQVMDKELKAIVWLGALLGVIMGCVNIFVH